MSERPGEMPLRDGHDEARLVRSAQRLAAGEAVRVAGVLFDMDGTLIDSISAVEEAWRLWAQEFGIPVPASTLHGRTAGAVIDALELPLGIRAHAAQRLAQIESRPGQRLAPTPGAVALLSSLPPGRWGVVTSAAREVAVARLRAADIAAPELLVAGEDAAHGKPAAEPFTHGRRALRRRWGEGVVVALEDTVAGLVSARRAGCVAVGVPGTHEAGRLAGVAHLMIPSLGRLTVDARGASVSMRIRPR